MLRLRRVPAQSDAEFHRFRADLRGELLLEFREFVGLGAFVAMKGANLPSERAL
jgi:hypothetical protein